MSDLYFNLDQMFKQEQSKDLLREAENYRLIKAIAQPESGGAEKDDRARHKGVAGLARRLASLVPLSPAQV